MLRSCRGGSSYCTRERQAKDSQITLLTDSKQLLTNQKGKLEEKIVELTAEIGGLTAEIGELKLGEAKLKEGNQGLQSTILQIGNDKLAVRDFASWLISKTVTVTFEPSKTRFSVHCDVLWRNSPYLRDASLAPDAQKGNVILAEEDYRIEPFQAFLEYCYLNTYFSSKYGVDQPELIYFHAQVYALADKLQCAELKAIALKRATAWCYGVHTHPDKKDFSDMFPWVTSAIKEVYTHTTDSASGLLPQPAGNTECGSVSEPEITRDRFRLLLAKLAAVNLTGLRDFNTFVEVHHQFPDFATDMLPFVRDCSHSTSAWPDERTWRSFLVPQPPQLQKAGLVAMRRQESLNFSKIMGSKTFAVHVGEEAMQFNIHESALGSSGYFVKLMASNWIETQERKVYLTSEVDTPEAFAAFVQHCYLGDYFCDESRADCLRQHAAVYVLADRLMAFNLKTIAYAKAMKLCTSALEGGPKPDEILLAIPAAVAIIYENTYDNSTNRFPWEPEASAENPPESKENIVGESNELPESDAAEVHRIGKLGPKRKSSQVEIMKQFGLRGQQIDDFRVLLASFASMYLSELREQEEFMAVHHAFPDFARDLMLLVSAGEGMELDGGGQLKLTTG
ncbi:hypothetical protein TWF481_003115 [Arthrobotrys musiformis]|uniref:BTB domain-containing protein n=1 Tax=Arthrobotrys musiformis TaxID=47236 RepID=A0AAV9VPA3_9PEZI